MNISFAVRDLLVATLFVAVLVPANFLFKGPGDGIDLIGHSATLFFDRDTDYENEVSANRMFPNGHLRPRQPIGSVVIASPVLAPFAAADIVSGNAVLSTRSDGYSGSWLSIGWRTASLAAFVVGLLSLYSVLRSLGAALPMNALFVMTIGLGIGGYFVFQVPEYSHVYSFLAFSVAAQLLIKTMTFSSTLSSGMSGALSVVAAAVALAVRPDSLIFLFPWLAAVMIAYVRQRRGVGSRALFAWVSVSSLSMGLWMWWNRYFYGVTIPLLRLRYRQGTLDEAASTLGSLNERLSTLQALSIEAEVVREFQGDRLNGALQSLRGAYLSPEVGVLWFAPLLAIVPILAVVLAVAGADRFDGAIGVLTALTVAFAATLVVYWMSSGRGYGLRYAFNVVPIAFLALGRVASIYRERGWPHVAMAGKVLVAWSSFGIAAQAFVDAVPGFFKVEYQPTMFPRVSAYVPEFAFRLSEALLTPGAWVQVLMARVGGFAGILVLPEAHVYQLMQAAFGSNVDSLKYEVSFVIRSAEEISAPMLVAGAFYVTAAVLSFTYLLNHSTRNRDTNSLS